MYNIGRMFGVISGILIGLVIAVIMLRFVNKNKKMTAEYDEMQKLVRGRGYMYAFYTVLIFEALMCVLSMGVELPAEQSVIHFVAIIVGVTLHACYCIWHNAYVGLNMNLKRYVIIMAVVSVFNLWVAFTAWREGELFSDGMFRAQTINLLCGLMFAVIGVVGLVKMIIGREEDA